MRAGALAAGRRAAAGAGASPSSSASARPPWPPPTRGCASAAWSRPPAATAPGSGPRRRSPPPAPRAGCRCRPARVDLAGGEPDPALLPRARPAPAPAGRRPSARRSATPRPGRCPSWSSWPGARLAADGVPVADAASPSPPARWTRSSGCSAPTCARATGSAVEDPGWANLLDLVAALGLEPVPMPVDDEGPTVDGLRRGARAPGAAAVIVTSRAQNPTGAAVSPAARRRAAAAAGRPPGRAA